jgi:hypothetical protein
MITCQNLSAILPDPAQAPDQPRTTAEAVAAVTAVQVRLDQTEKRLIALEKNFSLLMSVVGDLP